MARPASLMVAAMAALSAVRLSAQDMPVAQVNYALTNVRIVVAPGRVTERGTVLVQNGRITAVGTQVNVPAEFVQLNLSGHSVYPGLIDAATSTGLPSTNRAPSGGAPDEPAGRGGGAPAGRGGGGGGGGGAGGGRGGSTPAPLVLPELDAVADAATMFAATPEELAALRAGGVTTVGLVFSGGLFPGRVGSALTGALDESRLALKSGVGQIVSFGTRRGGYPNTGIGSVAFIRQSFLDAQHELAVDKAFTAGTSSLRPSYDPLRRALMPVVANESPAWFVASNERQLGRVAEIATEMGLRNWIVVGAQEGFRNIAALKQSGATVVVSLNWPNSVTGAAFSSINSPAPGVMPSAGGRGAGPGTMNQIRSNAIEIARAGIPVVLSSYGGESGAVFRDRIRATIEAGMSADDALRATTVAPAALLGISSAVGTVEQGKLANLVVVNGNDLFATGANITHVFVEGRMYTDLASAGSAAPGGRGGRGGGAGAAADSGSRDNNGGRVRVGGY